MTSVLIRLYGRLAEQAERELTFPICEQGLPVSSLRHRVAEQLGVRLLLDQRVRAAVGDEIVQEETIVRPGDEVDFLAPVSGG